LEMSVVEEVDEDVEEVQIAPRSRQGSILPAFVSRKTSFEVCTINDGINEATGEEGPSEGVTKSS